MSTNTHARLEVVRVQTQVEKKDQGTRNGNICHLPCLCNYVTGCEQISSLGIRSLNCEMRLLALPPAVKIKGYVSKREEFHICWYLVLWCKGV